MNSIVYIKIDGNTHQIIIQPNETIIDACERNGIDVPQSCLSGYCSTCKCKLVKGDVRMVTNLCLTNSELENDFILACQAKVKSSPIIVDFD